MFGFIAPALLAEFALYLTHYPFLWLLPPCFYLLERSTPGPDPGTASWELIGQTERIASPLLKPSHLIYIGAAAFGEAKKQPTTLVSASPGYRYLQRRSTNRTIEQSKPNKPNSIEAYPMRLPTVLFVLVTALCTRYFFDAMSSLDDDGDSDGGNELFKALDVEQDSVIPGYHYLQRRSTNRAIEQ